MFCGIRSFSHVDDDDLWSTRSSPRKSRKKEKNPYSNRGLDKFSTLLADLEERREKIMAKVGHQDLTLVRFVHSSSNGWVPIVVKLRDPKQAKADVGSCLDRPVKRNSEAVEKSSIGFSTAKEVVSVTPPEKNTKKSFLWNLKKNGVLFSKPSYYWPLVIILILLCLMAFGRTFAIFCTSIWWYLVPTMKNLNVNEKRSMKKEIRRRSSGKKLGGDVKSHQHKILAIEALSPRHHLQGRK
ncbi:uncharacterized protein LOC131229002 [Magnolia sinica]|uniref:uncharacterized protein LOC131229002 n=1 Tax=Magnolia sinica TaxID=86752 RepID=UPI002658F5B3|nr:uncharacterized protein LOC131229002 [Magnolia sinica]